MKNFSTQLDEDGILTISIDVTDEAMNILNESVQEEFGQLAQMPAVAQAPAIREPHGPLRR